jgi:tetratricopeptide (TPR) repeat protein
LEWLHGLVESLGAQAKFDEARNVCDQMQMEAVAAHDELAEARTWNALAFLNERQGRNRESIQAAERAIEVSARAGPEGRREQSRALYLKGWAQYRLADAGEVLAIAGKSLELARQLGDKTAMALSCKLYGVAHLQLCHYAEADRYFHEGLTMAREIGDLRTVAAMWSNRGEIARARSDYATAAGLYAEAVTISREIGARESEMIYLANLHAAQLGMGRCAEAEAGLRELLVPAANVRMLNLAEVCVLLSEACLLQGKIDEAAALARQAQAAAESSHDLLINADAGRMRGRAAAAAALLPATVREANRCFQKSLDLCRQIQSSGGQARTLVAWADLDIRGGNIPVARRRLEAARAAYLGLGVEVEAMRIDERLSCLEPGTPTPPQAT